MSQPNTEFCQIVEKALEDIKAQSVVKIDLFQKSALCDYMFIATGTSTRHVKAISDSIIKAFKDIDIKHIHREGVENNNWIVLDLGDVIVHIFQQESRDIFKLEEIWNPDKPQDDS